MFKNIRNRLLRIRKACGIEIVLMPDEEVSIKAVILRLDGNRIIKEKELGCLRSFEELSNKVPNKFPVAVVVNGNGVLHKKIPANGLLPDIFEMILPNANPAEFYMEMSRYSNSISAFIVRRDVLDKMVQELLRAKFSVLSAVPGAGAVFYLAPYLNIEKKAKIRSNTYIFSLTENREVEDINSVIAEVEENWVQLEYNIGDQYVKASGVIAFGTALGLMAGSFELEQQVKSKEILMERSEFKFFKYFTALSWGLLVTLLSVLLVNFLFFNYYFNKNATAQSFRMLYNDQKNQLARLELNIHKKEDFIQQFGWDRPGRLSYYADRIGGLVSENILLTTLKVFPVNETLFGENAAVTFRRDTILVSGTCEDPTELNRFANNLKNISDFREVDIKNYQYRKEAQSGIFLMQIVTI